MKAFENNVNNILLCRYLQIQILKIDLQTSFSVMLPDIKVVDLAAKTVDGFKDLSGTDERLMGYAGHSSPATINAVDKQTKSGCTAIELLGLRYTNYQKVVMVVVPCLLLFFELLLVV
jgi:hypothetical protein